MSKQRIILILFILNFLSCKKDNVLQISNSNSASCVDCIETEVVTETDCGDIFSPCGPPNAGSYFYGIIEEKEIIVAGSNKTALTICNNADFTFYKKGGTWLSDANHSDFLDAGISMVNEFTTTPTENEVYEMFAPGSYVFGDCVIGKEGVQIEWFDGATISWRSEISDQTGSIFTITRRGNINNHKFEIEGSFNCNLYFGNKRKTLTSGQFRQIINLN